tara:strand:+ start:646 stop:867 length:222 start_codon:yes stop_codon:yes gene_type:complete
MFDLTDSKGLQELKKGIFTKIHATYIILIGSKDLRLEFAGPSVVENNVIMGELGRVLEHLGYNFCRLTKNSFS